MTSSELELSTFRLEGYCLKHVCLRNKCNVFGKAWFQCDGMFLLSFHWSVRISAYEDSLEIPVHPRPWEEVRVGERRWEEVRGVCLYTSVCFTSDWTRHYLPRSVSEASLMICHHVVTLDSFFQQWMLTKKISFYANHIYSWNQPS
jgi:hypothetical protein